MAALLLAGCSKKDDPAAKQQTFAIKVNYTLTNINSPYSAEVISESDVVAGQGTYSAERYSSSGRTVTGTEVITYEMTATNQAGRTITFTVAINGPSSTTPSPLPASAVVSAEVLVDGTVKKTFQVNSTNAPDSFGKRTVNYSLTL